MSSRFGPTALMIGNFAIASTVMSPAGMLPEVSASLNVSIREASYLTAFDALVLCIGSPLTAWFTSRIDRRILLAGCLALVALGHLASVMMTSFWWLLAIRLLTVFAAAPYTAQAAGAVGLLVPEERRSGAIVYVFLGWSLAMAIGLPTVTYLSSRYGWQAPHLAMGLLALSSAALVLRILPRGLKVAQVVLATWMSVFTQPSITLLLLLTTLLTAGQFVIITFIGPLLMRLTGTSSDGVGFVMALYGVMGIAGNWLATYLIRFFGVFRTSLICTIGVTVGISIWAVGAGSYSAMAAGVALWGLGFAASSSLQQARLVTAAPALASASVALNTSMLYIGQATGATIGGFMYEADQLVAIGYAAVSLMLISLPVLIATRPKALAQSI